MAGKLKGCGWVSKLIPILRKRSFGVPPVQSTIITNTIGVFIGGLGTISNNANMYIGGTLTGNLTNTTTLVITASDLPRDTYNFTVYIALNLDNIVYIASSLDNNVYVATDYSQVLYI